MLSKGQFSCKRRATRIQSGCCSFPIASLEKLLQTSFILGTSVDEDTDQLRFDPQTFFVNSKVQICRIGRRVAGDLERKVVKLYNCTLQISSAVVTNALCQPKPYQARGGGLRGPDDLTHSCQSETSYSMMPKLADF